MIEFEIDSDNRIISANSDRVNLLIRDFVNDLARETEERALEYAPVGETRQLSTKGVVLNLSFRRRMGRYESSVELNPKVEHAKWVHEGTGLYGPYKTRIVPTKKPLLVFNIGGDKFRKRSVRGQPANPFLTDAFEYVNNVYAPAKLAELRAEIAAAT